MSGPVINAVSWLNRSQSVPGTGCICSIELESLGVKIGKVLAELQAEGVDVEHVRVTFWKETPPWVAHLDWRSESEA